MRKSYASKRANAAASASYSSTPHAPQNRLLQLQRTIGNQATIQLMKQDGVIQRSPFHSSMMSIISVNEALLAIAQDEAQYKKFRDFCFNEHNAENLMFLEAVSQFKDYGGHVQHARSVYNRYVSTTAPFQINISGGQRAPITADIQRGVAEDTMFDKLVLHVAGDLSDPISRFTAQNPAPPAKKKGFFSRLFG